MVLSPFSVSLLPSPLPLGLPKAWYPLDRHCWGSEGGDTWLWVVLPCAGNTKLVVLCVPDEAQALGMMVAICRTLWWCNQQKSGHISHVRVE